MSVAFEGPVSFPERVTLRRAVGEADVSRNVVLVIEAVGELNWSAYQESLRDLARRHEALRTSFVQHRDGTFRRRVHDYVGSLLHEDFRSETDPEQTARAWIASLAGEVWPLDRVPLCQAATLRVADDRWLLVFVLDHVNVDLVSAQVALRDLGKLYDHRVAGRRLALGSALQPRDIAEMMAPTLAPVLRDPTAAFPNEPDDTWTLQPDADLPGDVVAGDTSAELLALPAWRRLTRIGLHHRVSPAALLAASLAAGLRADAGRPDVSFAMVRMGRSLATRRTVGFQVFTDLWRVRSPEGADPHRLLAEAADFVRSDDPWRRAYVALRQPPTLRIVLNATGPHRPIEMHGLTCALRIDMAPPPKMYKKFDFMFRAMDMGPATLGALGYRARRFQPARIRRIAATIQETLAAFAEGVP